MTVGGGNISVIRGDYVEQYTPTAGPIKSTLLKNPLTGNALILSVVRFMVATTGTITYKSPNSSTSVALPVNAGQEYFLLAKEISAASGNVFIIHDGEASQNQQA